MWAYCCGLKSHRSFPLVTRQRSDAISHPFLIVSCCKIGKFSTSTSSRLISPSHLMMRSQTFQALQNMLRRAWPQLKPHAPPLHQLRSQCRKLHHYHSWQLAELTAEAPIGCPGGLGQACGCGGPADAVALGLTLLGLEPMVAVLTWLALGASVAWCGLSCEPHGPQGSVMVCARLIPPPSACTCCFATSS